MRNGFAARAFGAQGNAQDLYNFETKLPLDNRTRFLEMRRNIVVGTAPEERAFSMPGASFDGGEFYKTLQSGDNLFWREGGAPVFRVGVVRFARGGEGGQSGAATDPNSAFDLAQWQALAGEAGSRVADPLFVNPHITRFASRFH